MLQCLPADGVVGSNNERSTIRTPLLGGWHMITISTLTSGDTVSASRPPESIYIWALTTIVVWMECFRFLLLEGCNEDHKAGCGNCPYGLRQTV